MPLGLFFVLAGWLAQEPPAPAPPPAATSSLDFAVFRDRVQPIFVAKRPGHARCISCHSTGTPMRLQLLSPGSTMWDEEQSRKNFDTVARQVVPGNPLASRLLIHPLATNAGGDRFHNGGKHWMSHDDPEWQSLATWVRSAPAARAVAASAAASSTPAPLDFEFFAAQVQPIFLAKRPGHARCISCHVTGTPMRLQPLSPGSATWDQEQSRKNFDAAVREVVPGNPQASRLLVHPLAPDAGGDRFHNGGKHWTSQDDPEWRTLAAWVRQQTTGTSGR